MTTMTTWRNASMLVDMLLESDIDDPREFMQRNVPEFSANAVQKVLLTYFDKYHERVASLRTGDYVKFAWWYPHDDNPYRIAIGLTWECEGMANHRVVYAALKSADAARHLIKDLSHLERHVVNGRFDKAADKQAVIDRNAAKDDYGSVWP